MARALVLTADLLFGSKVQAALTGAGYDVRLVGGREALAQALTDGAAQDVALVLDMTDPTLDAAATFQRLSEEGTTAGVPALAFYSHVDVQARERAKAAGIELVVPRSRMAREAPQLVAQLLTEG